MNTVSLKLNPLMNPQIGGGFFFYFSNYSFTSWWLCDI